MPLHFPSLKQFPTPAFIGYLQHQQPNCSWCRSFCSFVPVAENWTVRLPLETRIFHPFCWQAPAPVKGVRETNQTSPGHAVFHPPNQPSPEPQPLSPRYKPPWGQSAFPRERGLPSAQSSFHPDTRSSIRSISLTPAPTTR